MSVLAREGDWAQIEAPGGSGPVWVQAEELDYALSDQSLVTVDLSRYQGQGALWVRTQEAPGLQDYAAEDALDRHPRELDCRREPGGLHPDRGRKTIYLLYGESYETVMPEGFSVAAGVVVGLGTSCAGLSMAVSGCVQAESFCSASLRVRVRSPRC